MKKSTALAILLAVGLVSSGGAAPGDKSALAKKQDSLNSEYALAKESHFYFILDVPGRRLELRVRGMVLRSWQLQSMRFWGKPEFSGNVELARKSTLKAPERIVIKPGPDEAQPASATEPPQVSAAAANPAEFDLEALELKDMPKRFSLDFDNGLHVTVRSKGDSSAGWLRSLGEAWRWYVALPLRNLLGQGKGKRLSELDLIFEGDKDAQAIYWHFFEGIKGVIL
jgi:hypothetical protein